MASCACGRWRIIWDYLHCAKNLAFETDLRSGHLGVLRAAWTGAGKPAGRCFLLWVYGEGGRLGVNSAMYMGDIGKGDYTHKVVQTT